MRDQKLSWDYISMLSAHLYTTDWDIDQRLSHFSGATREDLLHIVRQVVAARAEANDDHPTTAGGQFAYIYGTAAVRTVFRRKKWLRLRQNGIEGVLHPENDLKIVYQSVDAAAMEMTEPRAISGKGSGADRIIDLAQGHLFTPADLDRAIALPVLDSGVWFFCVSVDGDDVRAELSLPARIENKNFKGFIERIFIVRPGEWSDLKVTKDDGGDPVEFKPVVTRK